MRTKFVLSASAMVIGLALAGGALAQQTAGAGDDAKNIAVTIPGFNDNSLLSGNTKIEDSYNSYDSHDSYNTRKIYADQTLEAHVSGISFDGGYTDWGDENRNLTTGSVSWSGGAFQNVSGIHTSATNTGVGAANQAATMVNANSNVTFGP